MSLGVPGPPPFKGRAKAKPNGPPSLKKPPKAAPTSGISMFDEMKKKKLRKASVQEQQALPPLKESEQEAMVRKMQEALAKLRVGIEGDEEEEDGDESDWSD
mmetsp:Transcript_22679/g.55206  ORF Transcript_22679/g.55206 Transcript_22679/m.55206 type:complete len:102 (+) Transcript_22679:1307-1612(+)